MSDSGEHKFVNLSNLDGSHKLALAIAEAHGFPGAGVLCSLTMNFSGDQPLMITAQFYADPVRTAEVMAAAAAQLQAERAGHAA